MSDNLPDEKELYSRDVGITRRQFLGLATLGLGGAALAACGPSQDSGITLAALEKTAEAEEREKPSEVRPPEMPAQVEVEPEPITSRGPVEREFADSVLVIGNPDSFPNISETILEIGYKPVWINSIPEKETLFKYPAVIYVDLGSLPYEFEGLQTYISQQNGGAIVYGTSLGRRNNKMFNFSGIQYKDSNRYNNGDIVIKFDPVTKSTSKQFVATGIVEHPITRDMVILTIGSETSALYLHPSCGVDQFCQGIIYGGENTYTASGDIQNPPIVAAREYPAGGRIVVGPEAYNFRPYGFGGEDNVQLIRNSLLWVLHKLP